MIEPVKIGNTMLYCGDCLEVLPTIGKADAVVTDPPYAIPTMVASGRQITRNVGDLSIVETAMKCYFGPLIQENLTDEGRVFVFCDGTSYPIMFRVLYGEMTTALLVWNKGKIGMGREFRKSHELILHGWLRGTPIFKDGIGRPDIIPCPSVSKGDRLHPAEKPVPLLCDLLRVCGKTILDPFMGSGSTGIACVKLGRKFIGIEIEPKYFDIACERIEKAQSEI